MVRDGLLWGGLSKMEGFRRVMIGSQQVKVLFTDILYKSEVKIRSPTCATHMLMFCESTRLFHHSHLMFRRSLLNGV